MKLQAYTYLSAGLSGDNNKNINLQFFTSTNTQLTALQKTKKKEQKYRKKGVCARGKFVINPFSKFNVAWTFLQQLNLIVWSSIFWWRVAVGVSPAANGGAFKGLAKIELIFDALFCAEVVLRFFIGIPYNEDFNKKKALPKEKRGGQVNGFVEHEEIDIGYIYDLRKIAIYLMRTTFFIDFVALIPFFMYPLINTAGEKEYIYYLYYLKVIRLLFNRSVNDDIEKVIKTLIFTD